VNGASGLRLDQAAGGGEVDMAATVKAAGIDDCHETVPPSVNEGITNRASSSQPWLSRKSNRS
jgi:hypothetical protein